MSSATFNKYHVIRFREQDGTDHGFVVVTDIFLSLWHERIEPVNSFDTEEEAERWANEKNKEPQL